VDDEPFILSALVRFFQHSLPGTPLWTASTAAEGLAHLGQGRVGVIVSDYRMPDMDGIAFLERCRRLQPGARRLLFTAYADPQVEEEARTRAGITAFVPKGGDPLQLLDAVRAAMPAETAA